MPRKQRGAARLEGSTPMKDSSILSYPPRTRAPGAPPVARPLVYLAILASACLVALVLSFTGQPVSEILNRWIQPDDREISSALFSVYYLVIGLLPVLWWPRLLGWQVGRIRQEWRLLAGLLVFVSLASAGFILLNGPIPFHNFPWTQFTVAPLSEEAVFRGVLFAAILYLLRRASAGERSTILAIWFSAIAFGLAHSSNYLYFPAGFVTFQIGEATLMGALLAYVRVKTDSLYPAIVLHALINFLTNVL